MIHKELKDKGIIPYCQHCKLYRFPRYSVAMSAIIYDENVELILLIQQYNNPNNVLVAGYVSMGESIEVAGILEVKEETNLDVVEINLNASQYYEKNKFSW